MRLEPEERRNYVLSQLDDYGRCYMTCLEMFVYRLWSRQRVLLKNCKLYEEKLMTISEVIGTLTGRDSVVDNNNAESAKLEKSLRDIHSIVFIPPIKTNDLALINKLLVKEEEESLDFMSLALSPSGSQLLSPLGLASMERSSSGGRHHSVIKSQSSSPSPSSHASVERMERESNNSNLRESATSFVRVNGSGRSRQGSTVITSSHNSPPNTHTTSNSNNSINNINNNNNHNASRRSEADLKVSTTSNTANSNGHVSVISSSVSSRPVGRPPRSANECLDSAAAIAAVTAAMNNHIETSSSNSQSTNQSNNNDRGTNDNGNGIGIIKKESDPGYTSRRNGSGKRSNGTPGGSAPKKSRNNRTKDDKEIVKCCSQKNCEYIERDNANNMRKHYRNWHDDIDYPPAPYVKKEMTTETVNQFLHAWMVQRKKKQPRGPRNESRGPEGWPAAMTIDGMLVYADESDTGHEDEDYEINEHLLTTLPLHKPPKAIEMSSKRSS